MLGKHFSPTQKKSLKFQKFQNKDINQKSQILNSQYTNLNQIFSHDSKLGRVAQR